MKWRTADTNTILKKGSLTKIATLCHFSSFDVTSCHSLYHWLSFVATRCTSHCTTRCHSLYHSLSLVIHCHSLYHLLSLYVPLAWLFINDLEKSMIFISEIRSIIIQKNKLCLKKYSCDLFLPELRQFLAWKRSFLNISLGGGGVTASGPPSPQPMRQL